METLVQLDWFIVAALFALWGLGMSICLIVAVILFSELKKECHGLVELVKEKEDFIGDMFFQLAAEQVTGRVEGHKPKGRKLCRLCPLPAIVFRLMEDRAWED